MTTDTNRFASLQDSATTRDSINRSPYYRLLWGERTVRSVANLTRRDAQEFLAIAGRTRIKTEIVPYALSDANTALRHLREGQLTGAAVLVPEHST